MSALQAQVAFAAEFVLFLAALAGTAVLLVRPSLLADGRWARWTMTVGFAAVGTAAFLHGSLLEPDAGEPAVVVPRLAGLALLAASTLQRRASAALQAMLVAAMALAVAEAAVLVQDDPGTTTDAVRMAGAIVLTGALLLVSRRSIPARVAAGAAGTVLLVVLAVSVTLSTVVVDNVEDEVLDRTERRSIAEATVVGNQPEATQIRATSVAQFIVERAADNERATDLLVALAEAPGSEEARIAAQGLGVDLDELGTRNDMISDDGMLAFVTPNGDVVPGAGIPAGGLQLQLGLLDVVQDAIELREAAAAPEIVSELLLSVAAAPVTLETTDGPRFVGVVLTADRLAGPHLERAIGGDPDLNLAIVGFDVVLASAGAQPPDAALAAVAEAAMRSAAPVSRTIDGRFLAASPIFRGADPIAALVASAPSQLAEDTRQSLFRTLFIVALLATLVAIVLAALIGNRIGQGLRRLTSTAEEIEAGNLDVRADLSQADELGVLGTAFDRMAVSLRTMTDELRDAAIDEARLRGRLEAVIGGMGEALVAVTADGVVSDFNQAAEELFGVRAARVRGRPVQTLSIAGPKGEDLGMRLAAPTGTPWASEGTVTRADGTEVPVAISGAALRGAAGEVAGTVAVVRDMRRERELDRMKTEFLSNISHEMKTPLTPIKGYAQMLATRDLPVERSKEFAAEIVVGARQLERVITQLVNFSNMAGGRLEPHPEPVKARTVLDDAVARWTDRLGADHSVERKVARGTPDLLVDRRLLDLSLDELLDNAVKYSPDGGRITLAARGNGDGVLVSVADHGLGVADDRLETIFGDFAQGDGSSTREYGGLGLGLPMVRHVALAHGGDLTCESAPGRGSTFTLHLPAVPS